MKKLLLILTLAATMGACSRGDALEIPTGSDVSVQKKDGVTITGRLVEVKADRVIVESREGQQTTVPRAEIAEVRAAPRATEGKDEDVETADTRRTPLPTTGDAGPSASAEPDADPVPAYRDVTLPAGTVLPLTLRTTVGSDSSNVEDQVRATLRRGVTVDGVEALPSGAAVLGHVTDAQRSARVKGRARVAFRFTRLDLPGDGGVLNVRTGTVARTAPGTKKRDAATIGGGAVGGAIVGGILGGGDGAAKGAVIGGAGGTGAVLATRGKEVRIAAGTPITVKLTAPLTVRVAVK